MRRSLKLKQKWVKESVLERLSERCEMEGIEMNITKGFGGDNKNLAFYSESGSWRDLSR